MKLESVFKTADGVVIRKTSLRPECVQHLAIKKALEMNATTLYAIEPCGRRTNYTDILTQRRKSEKS